MTDRNLTDAAASLCDTTTHAIEDVKDMALAAISELKSHIVELEAELATASATFHVELNDQNELIAFQARRIVALEDELAQRSK